MSDNKTSTRTGTPFEIKNGDPSVMAFGIPEDISKEIKELMSEDRKPAGTGDIIGREPTQTTKTASAFTNFNTEFSNTAFYKGQKSSFNGTAIVTGSRFVILDLSKPEDLNKLNEVYNQSQNDFSNVTISYSDIRYSESTQNWKILLKIDTLKFLNSR